MTLSRRLIVYAKRPLPGYAKTRLGKALGAEQAAGVYARLLYTYLAGLTALVRCSTPPALTSLVQADTAPGDRSADGDSDTSCVQVELSVAAPADVPFFAAAFPEFRVRPQVAGDLGTRMAASFAQAFQEGAPAVVLTGSDIPGLDAALVTEAFRLLETTPAVIGPAADGGYYLLGLQAPGADLFTDIAWSTDQVLAQTAARARAAGLSLVHLPELLDVDTIGAYELWREQL
jgi:rSAM/selenodomain-associated transferase 1